jgi:hypothetical protein
MLGLAAFCNVTMLTTRIRLASVACLLVLVLLPAELELQINDMNADRHETALYTVAKQLLQLYELKVQVNGPFTLDKDMLLVLLSRNRLTVLNLCACRHTELDPWTALLLQLPWLE